MRAVRLPPKADTGGGNIRLKKHQLSDLLYGYSSLVRRGRRDVGTHEARADGIVCSRHTGTVDIEGPSSGPRGTCSRPELVAPGSGGLLLRGKRQFRPAQNILRRSRTQIPPFYPRLPKGAMQAKRPSMQGASWEREFPVDALPIALILSFLPILFSVQSLPAEATLRFALGITASPR